MDGNRFDTLVKSVARRAATRRGFAGIVAGALASTLASWHGHPVLAKSCSSDKDCEDPKTPTKCCSGSCRRIFNRTTDCGACNNVCLPTEECCGLVCADLKSNDKNCGACATACADGERCCGGKCRIVRNRDTNCGECDRHCQEHESCCGTDCVDLKNDRNHCGDCLTPCKRTEICQEGKCVKETSATGAGSCIDLVAACLQPSDPVLSGNWQIGNSAWFDRPAESALLPLELQRAIGDAGGITTGALVTSRQIDDQGAFDRAVTSLLLSSPGDAAATEIVNAYLAATGGLITPLDHGDFPPGVSNGRIARYDAALDPTLAQFTPGLPAVEVIFQVGPMVSLLTVSGDDAEMASSLAATVVERLSGGAIAGNQLIAQTVYAASADATLFSWYSLLDGHPQRVAGLSDDDWARQRETEGDAINFARLVQTIPSVEEGTNYRLSTWASEFASNDAAQDWLDSVAQRLSNQNPTARIVAIDEATGMGDASQGFLYAVLGETPVTLGVSLYARTNARIVVVGFSVSAPEQTPGLAPLMSDPRPLGKGAQTVLGLQLPPPDGASCDPRAISVADLFAGNPLAVATKEEPPAAGPTCCQYDCAAIDASAPPAIFCGPAGMTCPTLEQCTLIRGEPFISARTRCLAHQQARLEACASQPDTDQANCELVANELTAVCNQIGDHVHAMQVSAIFCKDNPCTKKKCNPLCNGPDGVQCIGNICPAGPAVVCDAGRFIDCTCQTEVVLGPPLSNSTVCDCLCDW